MKKLILPVLLLVGISTYAQQPTPKEIIEKYLNNIGGQVALKGIKDITMDFSGEVQGQSITNTTMKKLPNKFYSVVNIDGMGEVNKTVFDGQKGSVSAMGQEQKIEGEMANSLKAQSSIVGELEYLTDVEKMSFSGVEKINGADCNVIIVKNATGESKEFYDVASGLKVRQLVEGEVPGMGKTTITIDYSDYKDVGSGIKFPHLLKQDMGMIAFELKASSIKINQNLDDKIFEVK